MSGELVGEVIAAAAELKSRGLSERGFHALVAIAEKCHHISRQGSVPWSHIRAGLYGVSSRTAERAVCDLKTVGVLRVVKPGFNNNHGRVCAPIYEILPLTDTDTQVTRSPHSDTDTQVAESPGTDTDKLATDTDKPGDRYRHPGVVLNGSINGSTNGESGAAAPEPLDVEAVPEHENALSQINLSAKGNGHAARADDDADPNFGLGPRPDDHCAKSGPGGCPRQCNACGNAKTAAKRWDDDHAERTDAAKATRAQTILDCPDCDEYGWLHTDLDDRDAPARRCPRHDWPRTA